MRMWLGGLLLALAVPAWASNAAWYRWQSKVDGRMVCAQTAPGEGWAQFSGPYRDASCSIPR